MSSQRRAHLKKKAGGRLATAFRKVLRKHSPAILDVEMFWPPDHDAIHFLALADGEEPEWDYSIPTAHWRLKGDPADLPDSLYDELHDDIRHLFRSTWKEVNSIAPESRAYLRLHDSTWSIDLRNGRQIMDVDRADYREPPRRPFRKGGRSTKRKRRNGELVRRSDPLEKVKRAYGITEDPDTKNLFPGYHWPKRGIRMEFERGNVRFIVYFDPFPDRICGIWIGAHAWEVDEILGRAKSETFTGTGRLWQYDVDGFMSVDFDEQDRVRSICR